MKYLVLTAALTGLLGIATGPRAGDLPKLGSSADIVLPPQQARMVGANMLYQLRAQGMVLDDPLLRAYINDLGYRLLAHASFPKDMQFTFFVVRDSQINAFAVPGGYIGVNSGLITATRNEDELAGVLAHEIAHITQHHIQRSLEDAQKMAPLAGLVMLGAVLASQGSSGDAAPAVIAGGMGAIAQRRINFTRKDEAEADRIGIETLAAAGFDVDGMAGFFSRMEQLMRPSMGGTQVPELLRTHPVTGKRISEAKARAHTLKQEYAKRPDHPLGSHVEWADTVAPVPWVKPGQTLYRPTADQDSATSPLNYRLMRERARILTAASDRTILQYYADNLDSNPSFDTTANRYGQALALTRNNQADKAIAELKPLQKAHPDNLALRMAVADAELHAGQRTRALAAYARMQQEMPANHAVSEAHANALLASGRSEDAARAATLLRPMLTEETDEPGLYRTYGRACALSGQEVRAAEAYADASFLSGHATDALEQLKRLLRHKDLNYYQRARIQARIDYIMPIALELKRRGIKASEQGLR